MRNYDVIVLGGGFGSRLASVVSTKQKIAAQIDGKPFFYYILVKISEMPISKVIFALGHKADSVIKEIKKIKKSKFFDFDIDWIIEDEPLGTGGAIKNVFNNFSLEKEVVVMNGDSIVDTNLYEILDFHKNSQAMASMLLVSFSDIDRYGSVEVDKYNKIIKFDEKIKKSNINFNLINTGVYIFDRNIIAKIPNKKYSIERELIPSLIGEIYGFITNSKFIDIGIPEDFSKANLEIREFFQ